MGFLTGSVFSLLRLALLALAGWAVIDAARRPAQAFVAASKLTKPAWLGITAAALAAGLLFGALGFLWIAGMVAAIVYLVDVRPAVRAVQNGDNRW